MFSIESREDLALIRGFSFSLITRTIEEQIDEKSVRLSKPWTVHEFQNLHTLSKEKVNEFVRGHFYWFVNTFMYVTYTQKKTFFFKLIVMRLLISTLYFALYFFITNRYEFGNKNANIFRESLAPLSARFVMIKYLYDNINGILEDIGSSSLNWASGSFSRGSSVVGLFPECKPLSVSKSSPLPSKSTQSSLSDPSAKRHLVLSSVQLSTSISTPSKSSSSLIVSILSFMITGQGPIAVKAGVKVTLAAIVKMKT
uniref:Glycogen [starch] synthase n=1 Tax=Glossina brevipalpis TaxID=37001 RepID=A0A1A9WAM7_9MUSC